MDPEEDKLAELKAEQTEVIESLSDSVQPDAPTPAYVPDADDDVPSLGDSHPIVPTARSEPEWPTAPQQRFPSEPYLRDEQQPPDRSSFEDSPVMRSVYERHGLSGQHDPLVEEELTPPRTRRQLHSAAKSDARRARLQGRRTLDLSDAQDVGIKEQTSEDLRNMDDLSSLMDRHQRTINKFLERMQDTLIEAVCHLEVLENRWNRLK